MLESNNTGNAAASCVGIAAAVAVILVMFTCCDNAMLQYQPNYFTSSPAPSDTCGFKHLHTCMPTAETMVHTLT
jgi:hypothetical protein